jgi:ubiquinone/menaquinone biosynthesis C-methylase UbiE
MDIAREIGSNGPKYYYFGFGDRSRQDLLTTLRQKIAPLRFNLAAQNIIEATGMTKDSNILEIGCGVGLLGQAIKEKLGLTTDYYGIDLNFDPGLKLSKEKGLTPVRADAVKLPFLNESFDSIVSTDVFEHIPNAETLVAETKRVLRPGGKAFIVISDPSEGRFHVTPDHIDRTGKGTDIDYWTELFSKAGFIISTQSERYRKQDWRRVFNLPLLRKIKDKPVLSCAFDLVRRPGVFILSKPKQ